MERSYSVSAYLPNVVPILTAYSTNAFVGEPRLHARFMSRRILGPRIDIQCPLYHSVSLPYDVHDLDHELVCLVVNTSAPRSVVPLTTVVIDARM